MPRDELFLATKMWPRDYGHESGLAAAKSSLAKLDTDYLGKERRSSALNWVGTVHPARNSICYPPPFQTCTCSTGHCVQVG